MTPRYSISGFRNSHFSGLRYRSYVSSFSSTWWISCLCCCLCCCSDSPLSGFIWIAMLSMYTDSHPWATSILKISFIIAWNVAREFVRPKNITRGSKRPWGIRNAAFHSSPSLILMLLYPHLMSNFVNRVYPTSLSITWGISGDTFRFFFMYLFRGRWSCTGRSFPSAFFMKKKLAVYGPLPALIVPHCRCSTVNFSISLISSWEALAVFLLTILECLAVVQLHDPRLSSLVVVGIFVH